MARSDNVPQRSVPVKPKSGDVFSAEWYQKNIPGSIANDQAQQLGITTDQLYKMYASQPGSDWRTQQGQYLANSMPGQYGASMPYTQVPVQNPPPILTQANQWLGFNKALGQPQQQQAAPQQPQMPTLQPQQPMPTVQVQQLRPTGPYGGTTTAPSPAITASALQQYNANAQNAAPLFNTQQTQQPQQQLGVQPLQPGQEQQQYHLGGYVQHFDDGGQVQDNASRPGDVNWYGGPSTGQNPWQNPMNLSSVLGAYALGIGTPGNQPQYLITNPTPNQGQMGQGSFNTSGVYSGPQRAQAASPQYAQGLPQGPWTQVPSVFGSAPLYQLPQSTQTPLTARAQPNAAQMPQAGPVPTYAPQTQAPMAIQPSGFNYGNVGGPPPPPAPGGQGLPPSSVPPQAPSMPPAYQSPQNFAAAHFNALADAGKAIYAHFGGDPNSATPHDIASFHSELQSQLAGGPPVKRRDGGMIPGSGNSDTVPAMLTPGEYVVNKDAVNRIGVGNLQAINAQHFDQGGSVLPREEQHKQITADASSQSTPTATDTSAPQSTGTSGNPYATSSSSSQGPAWQNYMNAGGRNYLETVQDPDPDMPYLRNAGYSQREAANIASDYSGQPISNIAGSGGPTANVLGGITSGITQAFDTYAKSIGSWKPQPSHIPNPATYQQRQNINLSQDTQT